MSLFRFFKRRQTNEMPKFEPAGHHLAFVLLAEPTMPLPQAVERAFEKYSCDQLSIDLTTGDDSDKPILTLTTSDGTTVFALLIDRPVPDHEAESGYTYSISSLASDSSLPSHRAHLVVTQMTVSPNATPVEAISQFTSILAALVEATPSVGIYWGNAGATHDRDFFLSTASEGGIMPRITLWTGFSRAAETENTTSFLSLGMHQIGLPNLYFKYNNQDTGEALGRFYDLLSYVADRGEALPSGDTVGVDENERIPVRYVASPANPDEQVWEIDMASFP